MAGDWMKVELELPDKPEVHYMAGALGIDADAVVGKLIRVWGWFDKHTEDGNATGVTFALLDRISGVTGFAEQMALCGWLTQSGHVLSIPNFDHHNGKTAKNRALTAKRVARSKEKSNAKGNATIVTDALPREEKRREEETTTLSGKPDVGDSSRFPEFWAAWPKTDRKQDKAKCSAKWRKEKLDPLADQILRHVSAQRNTRKWQDGYEPAPLTYLNGKRWLDDEGAPEPAAVVMI